MEGEINRPLLRAQLAIKPWPAVAIMVAMLMSIALAYLLTPQRQGPSATPDLDAAIPKNFSGWREIPSLYAQVSLVAQNREAPNRDQPYDAVLMRDYAAPSGAPIMLALAYAAEQRQDIKIHRPEICYPAQGFEILRRQVSTFTLPGGKVVPGVQLLVRNRQRLEAVSYWIRIGDTFPNTAWAMRAQILRDGIQGKISDGILVRASSVIDDESQASIAFSRQQQFFSDLVRTVDIQAPGLLASAKVS